MKIQWTPPDFHDAEFEFDGTSKGGMVVAIQKELGLPIKFIGLGEQPDDLQPFDAKQFAQALFEE
jgi:fused signal recognition particle receptor